MQSNVDNATLFLVNTLFSLYVYVLLLRVILQLVRAEFHNPLSQFIWRVSNPPILPLRRVVPRFRNWDLPAILVALIVVLINLLLALAIMEFSAGPLLLLWLALLKLIVLTINLLTFTILVQAVMSWFGASMQSPASSLLWNVNEPLLRPVRRVIPPIGGLDLSPLFVIIALQVVSRLIPLSYALR